MTNVGHRRPPPIGNRFRKGQSGNQRGRPKKAPPAPRSAFDIVIERTLTITKNGSPHKVTVEEAMQHRTYQDAIAGNRAAQREILKMISKRDKWLLKNRKAAPPVEFTMESVDPQNADEALLVLGIADPDKRWPDHPQGGRRLLLQPWAVQRALSRGRRPLSRHDVAAIVRCTLQPDTLRWPAGAKHDEEE